MPILDYALNETLLNVKDLGYWRTKRWERNVAHGFFEMSKKSKSWQSSIFSRVLNKSWVGGVGLEMSSSYFTSQ